MAPDALSRVAGAGAAVVDPAGVGYPLVRAAVELDAAVVLSRILVRRWAPARGGGTVGMAALDEPGAVGVGCALGGRLGVGGPESRLAAAFAVRRRLAAESVRGDSVARAAGAADVPTGGDGGLSRLRSTTGASGGGVGAAGVAGEVAMSVGSGLTNSSGRVAR